MVCHIHVPLNVGTTALMTDCRKIRLVGPSSIFLAFPPSAVAPLIYSVETLSSSAMLTLDFIATRRSTLAPKSNNATTFRDPGTSSSSDLWRFSAFHACCSYLSFTIANPRLSSTNHCSMHRSPNTSRCTGGPIRRRRIGPPIITSAVNRVKTIVGIL